MIMYFPKITDLYNNINTLLERSGNFAPIMYMAAMIFAIIISPIPASPLTIVGSAIFGSWLGMIYTLVSATIGAVFAFLIARFFLSVYVSKKLEKNKFYQRLKGEHEKNIAKMVLITRLMPHVSFDIVSYAAGLTNLNVFVFAFVTFIGMIPIVFLLSFFGSLVKPYLLIMFIVIGIFFILSLAYQIFKEEQ